MYIKCFTFQCQGCAFTNGLLFTINSSVQENGHLLHCKLCVVLISLTNLLCMPQEVHTTINAPLYILSEGTPVTHVHNPAMLVMKGPLEANSCMQEAASTLTYLCHNSGIILVPGFITIKAFTPKKRCRINSHD